MSRERERGAIKLKAIFWLLVLGVLIFVLVKTVPAIVNNYQLEDFMKTEARFAPVQKRSEEDVRENVLKKIRELGIPARREDIRVESSAAGFRISVKYTVVVELPGYQFKLDFNPSADSRGL